MGTSRDADGVTRRWATAVGPADAPLPDTDELFDAVIWQYGTTPDGAGDAGRRAHRRRRRPPWTRPATPPWWPTPSARHGRARRRRCARWCCPGPSAVHLDGPLPLVAGPAPAAGRRAELHHLLHARPRRLLLRRQPRAPGRPPRPPRHLPPAGRHRAAGRHRPVRRRRPARPGRRRPRDRGRAPLRGRRRSPPTWRRSATELSVPDGALAGRLPLRGPPRHPHRGRAGRARPRRPRAPATASIPTPAVGGTPRAEALAFIAAHEAGDAGLLGRPGGLGRRRRRRGVDDRHPQRPTSTPTGRRVTLRAGAGIVADSEPEAEAAETNVKLATVLDAWCPGPQCSCGEADRVGGPGDGRRRGPATCGVGGQRDLDHQGRPAAGCELAPRPCRASASAMARTMARPEPGARAPSADGSPW